MQRLIRPKDMLALEQRAFQAGLQSIGLMERAAQAVCEELQRMLGGLQGRRILFACGSGNNGGDGLAAARLAQAAGADARVLLPWGASTPDAAANLARAQSLHISIYDRVAQLPAFDALVDALFGIGLSRPLAGEPLELVQALNALELPALAVDIPSGMDARTGQVGTVCIQAAATVTFQYPKTGHALTAQQEALGQLVCRDIGLESYAQAGDFIEAFEAADLPKLLPSRAKAAHKGSCGRALLCCGSLGMAGAAAMAALGCLRAGAGLTQLILPRELIPILQVLAPNATCIPLDKALAHPPQRDVLLAGCGMGQEPAALQALHRLYDAGQPAVLDADALNLLAQAPFPLSRRTLLTPHVGEAARLLGCSPQQVMADLPAAATAISRQYGAVTLLKSHCSVIADGERIAFHTVGSPVLAKGGSGDALAGIVAGLMAQGMDAYQAARVGSLWLGRAAQLAAERHGVLSALTGEVLALLGEAAKG